MCRIFTKASIECLSLFAIFFVLTFSSTPLTAAQETPTSNKPPAATPDKAAPASSSSPSKPLPPRHRVSRAVLPAASRQPASKAEVAATPVLPSVAPESIPAPTQAAEDRLPFMAETQPDSREQPASAFGLLLRTLGALLLIVGLIVAAAWGMKRFGGARFGAPHENAPKLAVLNSLSLGDRRSLAIVRFGDRTLLLGSTAQTITVLAETEGDAIIQPRSVAEILNDEQTLDFSDELLSATKQLDVKA